MLEAGGYWRPLAAVARLLEELGELARAARSGSGRAERDLASELADLWIITTALADQFRIAVPEPPGPAPPGRRGRRRPRLWWSRRGAIARVVNYYDGPKLPRSPGDLPSLTEAIGAFHGELELLCATLGVDLSGAVKREVRRDPWAGHEALRPGGLRSEHRCRPRPPAAAPGRGEAMGRPGREAGQADRASSPRRWLRRCSPSPGQPGPRASRDTWSAFRPRRSRRS